MDVYTKYVMNIPNITYSDKCYLILAYDQCSEEFVYKVGEDQRLKKQKVTTGRTFYGSTVEIKEGITSEDQLAFPYGKNVREGVKIREASLEELYTMY